MIDLGQVRSLSDLGITLDATSPSAQRHSSRWPATAGDWQAVPAARNIALDPGTRCTCRCRAAPRRRYAQLTVFQRHRRRRVRGEFRTFGPDPAAAGMDLGADLSFTPQELAAGAKFTYRGRQPPGHIMRENGGN